MTKIVRILATVLFAIGTVFFLEAQEITEGYLKLDLTDVKAHKPEMEQMLPMMQGSTQEIFFTPQRQKIVMGMMSGMFNVQIFQDFDSKVFETYMDMMGNKIKTVMNEEDLDAQKKQAEEALNGAEVVYDRNDRKEILGYDCYKATLKVESNDNSMEFQFYLSDEVKVPQAYIQNLSQVSLDGTPMEMMLNLGALSMTFTAKELSQSIPADFFTKPAGDYKTMTKEELEKMGLGGGFGF